MTLQIYQIGNQVLDITNVTRYDNYDQNARSKPLAFAYKGRHAAPYEAYTPELQTIDIDMLLRADCLHASPDERAQQLRRMVGKPTVITAYLPVGRDGMPCLGCGANMSDMRYLIWFQANGRLKDFAPNIQDRLNPKARLRVEIHSYWRELNPYLWELAGAPSDSINAATYTPTYDINTTLIPAEPFYFFSDCPKVWRYRNPQSMDFIYDPDYWAVRFNERYLPNRPFKGGGRGRTWSTLAFPVEITPPTELYGAPVSSVYAVRDMLVGRTLYLTTWRSDGDNTIRDDFEMSTSALNTAIVAAGFSTLQQSDVLLFGDIRYQSAGRIFRPFVLLRGSTVIDIEIPIVASTTGAGLAYTYEGELGAGNSRFWLQGDDMETAWIHYYQRL